MATYTHFYDLPVYKACRNFRRRISKVVREYFPKSEQYLLTAQLLDSSRSVTSNIAEGFGRYHHSENIQHCRISRGSLMESMDHLITARDDEYINDELLAVLNKDYKECLLQLNLYVKYLKEAKSNAKASGED